MRGSKVWQKVLGVQQVTIDCLGGEGDGVDEVLASTCTRPRQRQVGVRDVSVGVVVMTWVVASVWRTFGSRF